jgi:hypothetical protein
MKARQNCPFHNIKLVKRQGGALYNCICGCGFSKNQSYFTYTCDKCFVNFSSNLNNGPCYMGFRKFSRPNHNKNLKKMGNKITDDERVIFDNNSKSISIEYGTFGVSVDYFKNLPNRSGKHYAFSYIEDNAKSLLDDKDIIEFYRVISGLLAFT